MLVEGSAQRTDLTADEADELINRLFSIEESTLPEIKIIKLAFEFARKHNLDFRKYFTHIHWGALTEADKYTLSTMLNMDPYEEAYMWNSLLRSDIVTARDLNPRKLGGPIRVQQLYSSKTLGLHAFFEYLIRAMQNYTRKLVIIKVRCIIIELRCLF